MTDRKVLALKEKITFCILVVLVGITIAFGLSNKSRQNQNKAPFVMDSLKTKWIETLTTLKRQKETMSKEVLDEFIKEQPLSVYEGIINRNPFFKFKEVGDARAKTPISPVPYGEKGMEPIFSYKGTITMDKVTLAAIEDVNSREITFVKRGEILGEYRVIDITDNTVILSTDEGQQITLKLFEEEEEGQEDILSQGGEK